MCVYRLILSLVSLSWIEFFEDKFTFTYIDSGGQRTSSSSIFKPSVVSPPIKSQNNYKLESKKEQEYKTTMVMTSIFTVLRVTVCL